VVHRDLKPGNILVNKDCSLKICDFGLARGAVDAAAAEPEDDPRHLTEYVVTRYYRAPEIVLLASQYGTPIDIWAVGCILCELVGRKPIFRGKDYMDQLKKIFDVLGAPSPSDLEWLSCCSSAKRFVARFQVLERVSWVELYPEASPRLLDAVDAMIRLNPSERLSAEECMRLPFFEEFYDVKDEERADRTMNWEFDGFVPSRAELQRRLHHECFSYPTFARAVARAEAAREAAEGHWNAHSEGSD